MTVKLGIVSSINTVAKLGLGQTSADNIS